MTPREAFFAPAQKVKANDAVGRVSAEFVTPYPPGIPVAAPGEVYNEAIVYYLEEVVAAGDSSREPRTSRSRSCGWSPQPQTE